MTKKQERLNYLTAIYSALDEELSKDGDKPVIEGKPLVVEIDRVRLTHILKAIEKVLAIDGIRGLRADSPVIKSQN